METLTVQTCIDGQELFLQIHPDGRCVHTPVDLDAFESYARSLNRLGKNTADQRTVLFRKAVCERFLEMLEGNPELREKVLNREDNDWRKKALDSLADEDLKRLREMESEVRASERGTRSDWLTRTSPKD